jgi:hypothetical protein
MPCPHQCSMAMASVHAGAAMERARDKETKACEGEVASDRDAGEGKRVGIRICEAFDRRECPPYVERLNTAFARSSKSCGRPLG